MATGNLHLPFFMCTCLIAVIGTLTHSPCQWLAVVLTGGVAGIDQLYLFNRDVNQELIGLTGRVPHLMTLHPVCLSANRKSASCVRLIPGFTFQRGVGRQTLRQAASLSGASLIKSDYRSLQHQMPF